MARRHFDIWLSCAVVQATAIWAPLRQTAWQENLLGLVGPKAARSSRAATAMLEQLLASHDVRAGLRACSPESAAMPVPRLVERIRREVALAEVISGFGTTSNPAWMSLDEAMEGPPFFENGWQVGVRHGFNWSIGKEDREWYPRKDDLEVELYGLRPFRWRGYPRSMWEASERAPYCLVNMHRIDAGSPLFGEVSVVFSNELVTKASLISSVDTGSWANLCNATPGPSRDKPFPPPGYTPDCSQYKGFDGLATLRHFDHLFIANSAYWNISLSHVLCRLLAPWGRYPLTGSDFVHYWEALPAAKLEYPAAVKFVIATFGPLFGTALGIRLQHWCVDNGWVLLWSPGLNLEKPVDFWTAVSLKQLFVSNQRIVDPLVLAKTSAATNMSLGAPTAAFRSAWLRASVTRRAAHARNCSVSNATWAGLWASLGQALPAPLRLEPLRAGACADAEACVGVAVDGSCLCYQGRWTQLVI